MKIAFFDSGIGGLSVLNEALLSLKNEEFYFYADSKNAPYGTKSKEMVLKLSTEAIEYLLKLACDIIVVACNTATSVAIAELRQRFCVPIIGMEPAVKVALDLNEPAKTLVIATPLTVKGKKLQDLIARTNSDEKVDLLALPKLVEFAQNGEFDSKNVKNYLKEEFKALKLDDYSSLVLGCTHFNYFKDSLRAVLPEHIKFLDGNFGTIKRVKSEISRLGLKSSEKFSLKFYVSGDEICDKNELDKMNSYLLRLKKMREI
ncbi:MAG: glutamate racemase [Campylobacter sp.]|nr:glutamate racemase [Campylobacter sp.]